MADGPVSAHAVRAVPAAKTAEFEALLQEVITAARGFDGHLCVDVLRPQNGGTYQVVFRYRTRREYEAWMASPQRRLLVARIDELLGPAPERVRAVDGWEGWFVAPDYAPPTPPKRWKMALATFAGRYPVVLVMQVLLGPVTAPLPWPVALLVAMAVTVPVMTWAVMPLLTRPLGAWLRR